MSRACLGKMIVFIYKWLKTTVFTHRLAGQPSVKRRRGAGAIGERAARLQKRPVLSQRVGGLARCEDAVTIGHHAEVLEQRPRRVCLGRGRPEQVHTPQQVRNLIKLSTVCRPDKTIN